MFLYVWVRKKISKLPVRNMITLKKDKKRDGATELSHSATPPFWVICIILKTDLLLDIFHLLISLPLDHD